MVYQPNMVVLAVMKFTAISDRIFFSLLDGCTVDEQKSILKYKLRSDQIRSLLAIIQIKYCFKKYINSEQEIMIKKDIYGNPNVVGWVGDISISHSADWIFTGISSFGRIGIDIECQNPFPFLKGSEVLFLSKTDLSVYQTIQNLEESRNYLLSMWTLKEAYLKEVGIGLNQINPTSLSFDYMPKNTGDNFTYNGVSLLHTYDIDGVAKAAVSTSLTHCPSIYFYKHEQQSMLTEMLCSK